MSNQSVTKRLIVMRHAKSSWDQPGLADFERPLNQRGLTDAELMGTKIHTKPDYIISSSAKRTRQTVAMLLNGMDRAIDTIEYSDSLYMASCQQLMRCVSHIDDQYNCAMLVAHNPGVGDFIWEFTSLRPDRVPTCSLLECGYSVTSWGEIAHSQPTEQQFQYPGMYRN